MTMSLPSRKERGLRESENKTLRKLFGPKGDVIGRRLEKTAS
jgi:hypothetical protein